MSIPRYQEGETVRVLVEGTVVHHAPCESPYPSELTVAVPLEGGGTYDVTVPLGAATIERLAPTVLPREIWGDRDGNPWFAICVLGFDTPRTMMLPGELHDLTNVGDSMLSPEDVDRRYGPITRVYPPAPATNTTPADQAEDTTPEKPRAPRLMLDDVQEDRVGDIWRVVADATAVGGLRLMLVRNGGLITWTDVVSSSGPLVLLERAGYRRTTDTATAGQLRSGQVVSCEEWEDGAPVTIVGWHVIADDACRLEVEYRPLGWISKITRTAAPDARITLWASVGGAR